MHFHRNYTEYSQTNVRNQRRQQVDGENFPRKLIEFCSIFSVFGTLSDCVIDDYFPGNTCMDFAETIISHFSKNVITFQ